MPIIINDFEMLVEPPNDTYDTQPGASLQGSIPDTSVTRLRPQDIERIVQHFEKRRGRLIAD